MKPIGRTDKFNRMLDQNCDKVGHRWVKEKGKDGPVCIRCGLRPLDKKIASAKEREK